MIATTHEMSAIDLQAGRPSKMLPSEAQNLSRRQRHSPTTLLTYSLSLITISCALSQLAQGFLFEPGPGKKHWTYNDQIEWDARFKSCGLRSQSPIDIQSTHVQENPNLKLQFFNYDKQIKFKLQNAHHTIKLSPVLDSYQQQEQQLHGRSNKQHRNQYNREHRAHRGAAAGAARPAAHSAESTSSSNAVFESADEMQFMDKSLPDLMVPITASPEPETSTNINDNNRDSNQQENNNNNISSEKMHSSDNLERAASATGNNNNVVDLDSSDSNNNNQDGARGSLLLYDGKPTVRLSTLDDENNIFHLHDIHLHWGERKDNGSEHAIDGRRGAMELHLVHIRSGLNKSSIEFNSDSLLVIGIIIESQRKSNAQFDPIVNSLTRINMTAEPEEIGYRSLLELLPDQLDRFYWYWGSLTTPPCYEVVNWIVMERRLTMNSKQIEMFRQLYAAINDHGSGGSDDDDHDMPNLIMPNIRTLQPLFDRPIFGTKGLGKRQAIHNNNYNRAPSSIKKQQQQQPTNQMPTNKIIVGINEDKNYLKNPQAGILQDIFENSNSNSHAISSISILEQLPSLSLASVLSFLTSHILLALVLITSTSFNLCSMK